MAGSVAEERIRAKVEASMRLRVPDARIIHELVLTQWGVRIDLAAVWDDGLLLAEIKSERDTLSRLQSQITEAVGFGCEVWLCLAEKWRSPIQAMQRPTINHRRAPIRADDPDMRWGYTILTDRNPCHVPELTLGRVAIRFETDAGLEPLTTGAAWAKKPRTLNSAALLNMCWADELRAITSQSGKASRGTCIAYALEHMTGGQIRRGVCAALRSRVFPRADPALDWRFAA